MNCECINWDIAEAIRDRAPKQFYFYHHHPKCPKYKTEAFPRLFMLDRKLNQWVIAPEKTESVINAADIELDTIAQPIFARFDLSQHNYERLQDVFEEDNKAANELLDQLTDSKSSNLLLMQAIRKKTVNC